MNEKQFYILAKKFERVLQSIAVILIKILLKIVFNFAIIYFLIFIDNDDIHRYLHCSFNIFINWHCKLCDLLFDWILHASLTTKRIHHKKKTLKKFKKLISIQILRYSNWCCYWCYFWRFLPHVNLNVALMISSI